MSVKRTNEFRQAGKVLATDGGEVRTIRMLTKADDVGFGVSDIRIQAGADATLGYKNCQHAVHIISGSGEVTDVATGQTCKLGPSIACYVGPKDQHRLYTHTDIHLLSIFSLPPTTD